MFNKYTFDLNDNKKKLLPFRKKLPLFTRIALRFLLPFIVTILYSYACLMLLQLALFNVILLGIMIIGLSKIWKFFTKFSFKYEYNYRNKEFKKHIERANEEYFRSKGVVMVGGEEGKWIEFQLPDTEDKIDMVDRRMSTPGGFDNTFNKSLLIKANPIHENPNEDEDTASNNGHSRVSHLADNEKGESSGHY